MKRHHVLIICIALFAITAIPRFYRIDNPVADWHSWRQADTAAVTRNFIKEGFTPFYPKFDSFNSLNETGEPNPNRYFFAEFPLYNMLVYPLYLWFGVNEMYARLVSIVAACMTTVFVYLLARRLSGEFVGVVAGVLFAITPYNIYYGRIIMPDPLHIMFSVGSLYFTVLWIQKDKWHYMLLAAIMLSCAVLTKPYGLILGLPIAYLLIRTWGISIVKKPHVYIFAAITLIPFLAWRWHIEQYPEGMFGTTWLFNQGDIRFTGSYFRWLLFDRMNRLIFATGGFVLFWFGIIAKRRLREGWFYHMWLAGIAIFFVVIAKGNVTHDYYQMPLMPVGAIIMARGINTLLTYGTGLAQRMLNTAVIATLVLMMVAFGWYEVRGYFNINHPEIVEAGQYIDKNLPTDAKVIAPYMADPAFLYQTNRHGWTIGGGKIEEFIAEGATHLVSVHNNTDIQQWIDRCEIVEQTNTWTLINLQQCDNSTRDQAPETSMEDER